MPSAVRSIRPDFPENGAQLLDELGRLLDTHKDEAALAHDAQLSLAIPVDCQRVFVFWGGKKRPAGRPAGKANFI